MRCQAMGTTCAGQKGQQDIYPLNAKAAEAASVVAPPFEEPTLMALKAPDPGIPLLVAELWACKHNPALQMLSDAFTARA